MIKKTVDFMRLMETLVLLTVIVAAFFLQVPLTEAEPKKEPEKKTINVAKHIVKGSNVTKAKLEAEMAEANKRWGCTFKFVQSGDPDEVDKVGDNNVPGALNVYGVAEGSIVRGGQSGYGVANPDGTIEIASNAKSDTLAHEFGHNPGGDSKNDHAQDNTSNLMYSGCDRKAGATVNETQQNRAREFGEEWLKHANAPKAGNGKNQKDALNDTYSPFIDIVQTDMWAKYNTLILSSTVYYFVNTSYSLGFYIDCDSDTNTGEPPYGMDYKVEFDPLSNTINFFGYSTDWVPVDPTGITMKYLYGALDAAVPVPTLPLEYVGGIQIEVPLSKLCAEGHVLSVIAFGQYGSEIDLCPDTGYTSILRIADHDVAILSVTPSKLIVGVGKIMTVGVILWNEGGYSESFSVSAFHNNTLIGTLPVVSLLPGNEITLLFSWNTAGIPMGMYNLSASATLVPTESDAIDNTYERWGQIRAGLIGDIKPDGKVDILDAILLSNAYGSSSGALNWNPNADMQENNVVDILDAILLAGHYGQSE